MTDFTADIGLSSDGQPRVTGQVRLRSAPTAAASAEEGIAFTADLGGDLTPFVADNMDTFFGAKTRLYVDGRTLPEGALTISDLELTSQALNLEGQLELAAGGQLQLAALQGRITPPEGQSVVLPVSGGDTSIGAAQISALFDEKNGNLWDLSLTAKAVKTEQLDVQRAQVSAQGTLEQGDALSFDAICKPLWTVSKWLTPG